MPLDRYSPGVESRVETVTSEVLENESYDSEDLTSMSYASMEYSNQPPMTSPIGSQHDITCDEEVLSVD